MQEAADILTGKREPARLHRPSAGVDVRVTRRNREKGEAAPLVLAAKSSAAEEVSPAPLATWDQGAR